MRQITALTNAEKTDSLEIQIVKQCSPLLLGLRISNMFVIDSVYEEEVFCIFEHTPISVMTLYKGRNKITMLLYVEKKVTDYLEEYYCRHFLAWYGYEDMELEDILSQVSERFWLYRQKQGEFPHELGIILGYPVWDVLGFIQNKGQNEIGSGYWKVYYNLPEAQYTFRMYNLAKEQALYLFYHGKDISEIVSMCDAEMEMNV